MAEEKPRPRTLWEIGRCLACKERRDAHAPGCRWKPVPDPDPADYRDGKHWDD